MIQCSPEICQNLKDALTREWLETNGLGGFASSTISGLNTRRYHGLLTAATKPPVGRFTLLSKYEESLIIDGKRFELSTNQYADTIFPQGFKYLKKFRLDPFPIFTFQVEGVEIEKSLFLIHGENSIVAQYQFRNIEKMPYRNIQLEVRPLMAFRGFHATTHENDVLNPAVKKEKGNIGIHPYEGLPWLYFAHEAEQIDVTGYWYRNFEYKQERERGLDCTEDLFNPFVLRFFIKDDTTVSVIASTQAQNVTLAKDYRAAEISRRKALVEKIHTRDEFIHALLLAADQFVATRAQRKTIVAGYHWFSDWGRDTMIALPGLTLSTHRSEVAKEILLAFSSCVSQGMLPNLFPDFSDTPEYNTVDATFWYFEAIHSYVEHTADYNFVKERLYPGLIDIIDWHVKGTRFGISMDMDGLLKAGDATTQLTWMDAKVGDTVVTPRSGKPVEIEALWYNALCFMADLAEIFDDEIRRTQYQEMASKAKTSFNHLFWNTKMNCLYDVINGTQKDSSIRPNQIFAVSLSYPLLSEERAKKVVECVEKELLTPFGLRSLSPRDTQYKGRCEGNVAERDGAYHQGTVWPWLMGPFLRAYLKVHQHDKTSILKAKQWVESFKNHLSQRGLGQISEIFDGNAPHEARGCIAQAFSVAEILRVILEDLKEKKSSSKLQVASR